MEPCYDEEDDGDFYEVDFHVPSYQGSLLQGLQVLREEDLLCDYVVSAEGSQFRVHKVVLASASGYFRALFRSGMIEVQNDCMDLKGVSGVGLRGVIHFMYSGCLRMNAGNVLDIFRAANHLQIEPAITACTQFLIKNLSLENLKDMQSIVDTYQIAALEEAIHGLLVRKFTKFSRTDYFKQLPLPEICKLLKENTLSCGSEFKLMKIIFEWVRYNTESREVLIGNLMKNVRLVYMSTEELTYLQKIPFIANNRHCMSQIEKALYFKTHPEKQALLVAPESETRNIEHVISFGCNQQRTLITYILYKDTWCPMDRTMDQPRPFVNAAVVVHNNFLYVCGGEGIKEATTSCLCFNPFTCKWGTISPMNCPRRNFALVAHGQCLYAIGGISKNYEVTDTVEVFSIEKNSWTYMDPYSCRVADVAACGDDTNIYVAGGIDDCCCHVRDFSIYQPSDSTWSSGPSLQEVMFRPTMFSIADSLYIIDLYKTEGITAHIEQYNPGDIQWTCINLPGVQFTRSFSAVNIDDWIYFVGRNDVEEGSSVKYNVLSHVCEDIRCFPWEVEAPVSVAMKLQNRFIKSSIQSYYDTD